MKVTLAIKQCNIDKLIGQLVVLVDTREQNNQHIISYFDKKGVKWRLKALETVDYSCELKANLELGLPFDITLENVVGIERKNSLTELAGNFTQGRSQFEEKWQKAKEKIKNLYLIIEGGSWQDIRNGNYRSDISEKALYNSLISWRNKYGFKVDFIEPDFAGEHILRLLQDSLRKLLKE